MARFFSLPVVNKKQETADAISISFQIPDELKAQFQYKQGQYLTLEADIQGEKVRRAYSLCSCPLLDDTLTVTVKRVEGGKMSNFLNDRLQLGSRVEVMPPAGRFYTEVVPGQRKHYFLIGGGSGITPMMSILRTVLHVESESKVTLIYGNRNPQSIIFKDALAQLQQQYGARLTVVHTVDQADASWTGEVGMLTAEKTQQLISQHMDASYPQREFFLCGPTGLMDQVQVAFKALQLPTEQIHIEFFTAPVTEGAETAPVAVDTNFEGAKVFVTLDGKEYELHIKDQTSILHAGVKAGIDPPFSCEAGICSTCMAKVTEGTVRMLENNILTDDEIAKGFVLTCQAHPTSKIVRLEYYD